ncbi:MAG: flippase [Chloroflexi bacterium]|nr:flippase [Chloroflexota bacterium]
MANKQGFVRGMAITMGSRLIALVIGLGASAVLARALGPEGKGMYALAVLLPSMIVALGSFGLDSATIYYTAREEISWRIILGNNVVLSFVQGFLGILAGFIIVRVFHENLFKDIAISILNFSLVLIPINFFFHSVRYILWGAQRVKEFNQVILIQRGIFFILSVVVLWAFNMGVIGAIGATFISILAAAVLAFHWAKMISGGVVLSLNPVYIRKAFTYGFQAYLANILGFLNYRADMFLVNWLMGPAAAGLYGTGVDIIERGWLISQVAGAMIFPRVAAAKNSRTKLLLTPLVARTVFWITAGGVVVLVFISDWLVYFLYSEAFLPAARALRGLAIGVISLSVGRVLSNDIAGRGRPVFNIYVGLATIVVNVILNFLWIPRYGIEGAAWASSVSYTISFLGALYFYCRLSGNHWTMIIFPQKEDLVIYYKTMVKILPFAK